MPVGDLFRAGADSIAEMLVRLILPILVSENLHGQCVEFSIADWLAVDGLGH